jgi:hypothetical protein
VAEEIMPGRADYLVELRGFEPLTSAVRLQSSVYLPQQSEIEAYRRPRAGFVCGIGISCQL